MTMLEQAKE